MGADARSLRRVGGSAVVGEWGGDGMGRKGGREEGNARREDVAQEGVLVPDEGERLCELGLRVGVVLEGLRGGVRRGHGGGGGGGRFGRGRGGGGGGGGLVLADGAEEGTHWFDVSWGDVVRGPGNFQDRLEVGVTRMGEGGGVEWSAYLSALLRRWMGLQARWD